jgi:hypothetical protein
MVWFGLSKCLQIETRGGKKVRSYVVTDDPRSGYSSTQFREMLDDLASREEAQGIESALRADDFGYVAAARDTSRGSRAMEGLNWAVPGVASVSFIAVGTSLVVRGHPPGAVAFGVVMIVLGVLFAVGTLWLWNRIRREETRLKVLLREAEGGARSGDES